MTELRDQMPSTSAYARLAMADVAQAAGLANVQMLAWRDLDDPEAGGSEVHCSEIARVWSQAGLGVNIRTSQVVNKVSRVERDGYFVKRSSGRYSLFPAVVAGGFAGALPEHDGLIEIWNGMPFFSPLWSRKPAVVFLHHVHAEMWKMVLPNSLARLGWYLESKIAPRVYRNSRIVTLSHSSKDEIVDLLGLNPDNISVIPPGIDPRFTPTASKSREPLIISVGRLVKVKRFGPLIEIVTRLKSRHPGLRLVIAGEGDERADLERLIDFHHARDWILLPGRVSDDELIHLYSSAWILASNSQREGWGMTITEAAACGTPCVVSQITGHVNALEHGVSGMVASDPAEFEAHLDSIMSDKDLRKKLSDGALAFSSNFSWQATARGTLEELAMEAMAHSKDKSRPR